MKVLTALMPGGSTSANELNPLINTALSLGGEGAEVSLLLCGSECEGTAGIAAAQGLRVYLSESESCRLPNSEFFAQALVKCIEENTPDLVLLPRGMNYLPGAAAAAVSLHGRVITEVESISRRNDTFVTTRSIGNGSFMVKEVLSGKPAVLTLQPGALKEGQVPAGEAGEVIRFDMPGKMSLEPLELEAEESARDLEEADVIVAVGRGIGNKDNIYLARDLVKIFPSSALAASRIVCDRGWLPYQHQVGITGKTVTPKVYLACGISGTSQHLAGMKDSRIIVAVNSDPGAPFFNYAHYGITEDIITFIPVLINEYHNEKGRK